MAQGSKSRVVIWTIVGILVVVAAVIIITKPKTNKGRPPINAKRFAQMMESRFQKLEKEIAEAQAESTKAPAGSTKAPAGSTKAPAESTKALAGKWQAMSDRIAHGRQVLAEMAGTTSQNQLRDKRVEVQAAYHIASQLFSDVTGKEVPADSVDSVGGE